ncbi:helix-turn-helix domain-containing protein [Salinirarus marinus]|uniref:helix-turn-helix domain-containing protein n=1 Tax=Salinirarus marinus TaxID=3068310 RepID=UPI003C6BD837
MSATESTRTQSRTPPAELVSAESKLVYFYLRSCESATVDDLHESLGMKKITIYPVLDSLRGRGLVARDGQSFRATAA